MMITELESIASMTIMKITGKCLYQVIGSILIVIGTVGCLINLAVFTRKPHRKNPCSIYFVAYNIFNLCYIYLSLFGLTLEIVYNINPSASNIVVCRLRLYLSILLNWSNPFFSILASIDRIMITSNNVHTRQRSTCRLAYTSITVGTLFWCVFHSHALIYSNIIEFTPNLFICYHQSGVYLTFIGYYSLIKEITALVLLIVCALWTVKNVHNAHRVRLAPNNHAGQDHRNVHTLKDRQLILMLLMDIVIYAIFSFLIAIFLMYQEITQNQEKNFDRIKIEVFIRNVCFLSIAIPFCSSCYTNLIASTTFRKEVKKVFLHIGHYCQNMITVCFVNRAVE